MNIIRTRILATLDIRLSNQRVTEAAGCVAVSSTSGSQRA
jgi:hypothetical protein